MLITSDKYGPLPFQPADHDTKADTLNPTTKKASGSFGEIIHQAYSSAKYSIHYFHLKITEQLVLHFTSGNQAFIKCHVCLQDDMEWYSENKAVNLTKDQYVLYDGTFKTTSLNCLPQASYRFMAIHYPVGILRQLRTQYTDLDNWIDTRMPSLVVETAPAAYASNNLTELLNDIANTRLPCFLQAPWLDIKITGLLIQLLAGLCNPAESKSRFLDEIAARAHEYILQHIGLQCSIPDVARFLQINTWYLKTSFKKRYGINIYQFLRTERLKYARHLVMTTDMPLKQISGIVGFDHTTNFSNTFRDHFKYTPGSLRRNK